MMAARVPLPSSSDAEHFFSSSRASDEWRRLRKEPEKLPPGPETLVSNKRAESEAADERATFPDRRHKRL